MFLLGPKGYWYNFLPEGLFDNLINLKVLWVNMSLFRLSINLRGFLRKNQEINLKLLGERKGLK